MHVFASWWKGKVAIWWLVDGMGLSCVAVVSSKAVFNGPFFTQSGFFYWCSGKTKQFMVVDNVGEGIMRKLIESVM